MMTRSTRRPMRPKPLIPTFVAMLALPTQLTHSQKHSVKNVCLSEQKKKEEKKETPLYEASDANDALNAGEYDKANKILDKVVESKMAEGKKKKEAISSVKSSFSSKYRKRYIAAGADERAKIEIELERLRVGGSRIFSSEDFARWRKSAKKK